MVTLSSVDEIWSHKKNNLHYLHISAEYILYHLLKLFKRYVVFSK